MFLWTLEERGGDPQVTPWIEEHFWGEAVSSWSPQTQALGRVPSFLKAPVCKYSLCFYVDSSRLAPRGCQGRGHPRCHPMPPQIQPFPQQPGCSGVPWEGRVGRALFGVMGSVELLTSSSTEGSEGDFPLPNPSALGDFSPRRFLGGVVAFPSLFPQ